MVNPETLFVVADCLLDGAEVKADEEHRTSACGVEVTAEMHALARMAAALHYNCHRLRTQAEAVTLKSLNHLQYVTVPAGACVFQSQIFP